MLNARVVLVANMKPTKMRGIESQAMVLCTPSERQRQSRAPPKGATVGERLLSKLSKWQDEKQSKKIFDGVTSFVSQDGVYIQNIPFKHCWFLFESPSEKEGQLGDCLI